LSFPLARCAFRFVGYELALVRVPYTVPIAGGTVYAGGARHQQHGGVRENLNAGSRAFHGHDRALALGTVACQS
jgi:hypothetical protein